MMLFPIRRDALAWRLLWNLSELTHIGLGRFAPAVFERIIGRPGTRADDLIGRLDG